MFKSLRAYPILRASASSLVVSLCLGILLGALLIAARSLDNRSCDHALAYCFDIDGQKTPVAIVMAVDILPALALLIIVGGVIVSLSLAAASSPYYLLRARIVRLKGKREAKLEK